MEKESLLEEKYQSVELREALQRQSEQSHRYLYETIIDYEEEHLKSCNENSCIMCKDAKVLIPYYRKLLKQGPRY